MKSDDAHLKPLESLEIIQRDFLTSIHLTNTHQGSSLLAAHICDSKTLSISERIDIYRNNTQQTRVRTLKDIYPIICEVLGHQYFNQQSVYFSQQHPAKHWNLNQYGEEFPEFLVKQLTLELREQLPYLKDLGQLEWLLHQSYYCLETNNKFPTENFQKLSTEEQTDCRLLASPSLALISTPWPIYQLWLHWQSGQLPNQVEAADRTEYLCIYKDQLHPTIERIDAHLYQLLKLCSNHTLTELSEIPEISKAMPKVAQCINKEWITDFKVGVI